MQTIQGTLVLVAPLGASERTLRETLDQALTCHEGPVVVLPHDWQAMSGDELRAKLDEAQPRRSATLAA